MNRKYISLLLIFVLPLSVLAQIQVKVKAPRQTEVGQIIRVGYEINSSDADNIQVGDFQGFELQYGPATSTQNSISMVNGNISRSSSTTFTYTLYANSAGTFKLPVATVRCNGKNYKSNQVSIQVLGSSNNGAASSSQGGPTGVRTQDAGDKITSKDIFIEVTASKKRIYEQEAVLLTYKLYSLVNVNSCTGKMPDLDGFHTQEIELPQQKSLKLEQHNGKNYGTVVWSQYVLFPQKTGKLTVPAINFEAEIVQQNRSMDPFDAFFNGGSNMVRVKKTVVAPSVELQVDPLPQRPANFSGAVGQDFKISASLTPQQVDANDAAQLRLIVSGTGNMKLMSPPIIQWPKDFETYDPKIDDKTTISSNGATGNVILDYNIVPRHPGKYTIPAVEFCYFDTNTNKYETLRTDSFQLSVAKGVGHKSSGSNQEELELLNSDIRYIKTNGEGTAQHGNAFFGTSLYWALYAIFASIFAITSVVLLRRNKESGNMARQRGKKASKAAAKRLKTANALLQKGDSGLFYDEVTRALWGYIGDKLNLPITDLNKDNVSEQLLERGVEQSSIDKFLRVLGDCEFARFAPGNPNETMDKLFNEATDVINEIETML